MPARKAPILRVWPEITIVIPGRPAGPSPEPMNTAFSKLPVALQPAFHRPCSWVPGSSLRDAPE